MNGRNRVEQEPYGLDFAPDRRSFAFAGLWRADDRRPARANAIEFFSYIHASAPPLARKPLLPPDPHPAMPVNLDPSGL